MRLTPQRRVPVAILGTETLDVTQIGGGSLRFGPKGAEPNSDLEDPFYFFLALKDINRDDILDLVPKFGASTKGMELGDEEAGLTGLIGHRPFRACYDLIVVGTGRGAGGNEAHKPTPPRGRGKGKGRRRAR